MKKLACLVALLLILTLAGCAAQGYNPQPIPSGNFNWGSDAACSPGCPPGMSGSW
ncbi:MAG: hypothetical protein AB1424_04820 [Thermodesulfobacteriota bacterium]